MSALPAPREHGAPDPERRARPALHVVPGGLRRPLSAIAPVLDRLAFHRTTDSRLGRSLAFGALALALVFLVLVPLAPLQEHELVRVVVVPPKETTVKLQEITPAVPLPPPSQMIAPQQMAVRPDPPGARRHQPRVAEDLGTAGRARARAATEQLATAGRALDRSLSGLASALPGTGVAGPGARRRARDVGSGRSDVGGAGSASSGVANDVAGSGVQSSKLAIGAPAPAASAGDAGGEASATAPGVNRSNASLLAVIQRHAAGIQYCYENELQSNPNLRGKLVVALTVAASGRVTAASVVENSLGAERVASCALAQMREWRFPAIPSGVTTFQAPFVFTPPR